MSPAQSQALAHELTIEYIRVHSEILSGDIKSIRDMVDKIADINTEFRKAIRENNKFDKLYL